MTKALVTSANSLAWEYLICFIASARENARWTLPIHVIDYGLTPAQRKSLENADAICVDPAQKYTLYLDRYPTLAQFAENGDPVLCFYDADIWFLDSFDEVFARAEKGKLLCVRDAWLCTFILNSIVPGAENRKKMTDLLRKINEKYRGDAPEDLALQSGFLCARQSIFQELSRLQSELVASGFSRDYYGTDTAALQIFAAENPQNTDVIDIRYNCVPKWPGFRRESPNTFFVGSDRVKAIHYTLDYRSKKTNPEWSFPYNFPAEFRMWEKKLGPAEG